MDHEVNFIIILINFLKSREKTKSYVLQRKCPTYNIEIKLFTTEDFKMRCHPGVVTSPV